MRHAARMRWMPLVNALAEVSFWFKPPAHHSFTGVVVSRAVERH
jgi:hypothetical protein